MNKRQKKKIEDKKDRNSALFLLKGLRGGFYKVFVAKKHWNKGCDKRGVLIHDTTGNYITMEYVESIGASYFGYIKNCGGIDLEVLKSWNNKNHLVRY